METRECQCTPEVAHQHRCTRAVGHLRPITPADERRLLRGWAEPLLHTAVHSIRQAGRRRRSLLVLALLTWLVVGHQLILARQGLSTRRRVHHITQARLREAERLWPLIHGCELMMGDARHSIRVLAVARRLTVAIVLVTRSRLLRLLLLQRMIMTIGLLRRLRLQ